MAAITYRRRELRLTATHETDVLLIRLGNQIASIVGEGLDDITLREALRSLDPLPDAPLREYPQQAFVDRLVIDVPDEVAGFDWEAALRPIAGGRTLVRDVATMPPFAERPLAFPLRIVSVGRSRLVVEAIDDLVRNPTERFGVVAVATARVSRLRFDEMIERSGWPTVDVLHVESELPPYGEALEWLERIAARYQTRLMTIVASPSDDRASLRRLAASLADRGGPAVLVVDRTVARRRGVPPPDRDFWFQRGRRAIALFYDDLIHDRPLDVAVEQLGEYVLVGGAGREESLRVSALATWLLDPVIEAAIDGDSLIEGVERYRPRWSYEFLAEDGRLLDVRRMPGYEQLRTDWSYRRFEDRESEGVFPTATELFRIRDEYAAAFRGQPPVSRAPQPQHLTPSVLVQRPDGTLAEVDPSRGQALRTGWTHHLRIQITFSDPGRDVLGRAPIYIADHLWDAELGGVEAELAVSGDGCTVAGAAIQRIFIPRRGESQPRFFAFEPAGGVMWLRYSLYVKNHLIQTGRLVATATDRDSAPSQRAMSEMAGLLNIDPATFPSRYGERSWLARIEYALPVPLAHANVVEPRTLSIVANDANGTPTITAKGRDYTVSTSADLDAYVNDLRATFNRISGADRGRYRFGTNDDPNGANGGFFAESLMSLADKGHELYNELFRGADTAQWAKDMQEPGGTVHVAHALREHVVPWSALYDFDYQPRRRRIDGQPVAQVACSAPIASAVDAPAVRRCGMHPDCVLHPDQVAARAERDEPQVRRETAACPLGFWGFRHQIEIPAYQIAPPGNGATAVASAPDEVHHREFAWAQPFSLAIGYNDTLVTAQPHLDVVRTHAVDTAATVTLDAADPDDILDGLNGLGGVEFDVLYIFSHADGAEGGKVPPELLFGDLEVDPRPITPADLDGVRWDDRPPFVILNGCGTTGFSTRSASKFIGALVDRRGAIGVLGADVPVHEHLASVVGETVLDGLLDKLTIGEALHRARWKLLKVRNPLGLVYALYAPLELRRNL